MFVRRFTIVSLLTILFGMFFAIIVAEAGKTRQHWQVGKVAPCFFDQGVKCGDIR